MPENPAHQVMAAAVARMPDPSGCQEVMALEEELAAAFGTRRAVAVSSGTAAITTALAACGIGAGDEVLLPAVTVVMTVAAVVAAGARPVFVEAAASGRGLDLADLTAKTGPDTKAVIAVHLAGRTDGIHDLAAYARTTGLRLIEDACQAQGTTTRGRPAGTVGDIGCFSLKDGKIIACGEGGYLLTDDDALADRAAAYRTHWQSPAPGAPAGSRLGVNYRLAEPLAALARHNLQRFPDALAHRRRQAAALHRAVDGTAGLEPIAASDGDIPNGYGALWRLTLPEPRAFAAHLAGLGVPNSVGTHRLTAAHLHSACSGYATGDLPRARATVDTLLAVPFTEHDSEQVIEQWSLTIRQEAAAWKS
ncbi:DegT/DnrJ/EryC1/StrS family aminotransferase [Streptomyces sp. BE303]|uniref:DegT/DnrJ/EryC1/StrS family aminotransferase n=1 Tax=Streptomyces sp. BE303 TaxID=3002528 RepID=UPI002E778C00|nr:aminotransferase class I/II-fold pyridoxal phosphate-dependent enzyme [Streptomyces sp. BE303]MED7950410.1 aminotransferase class I/II-fold pyridoxal phosphate-dependent enzyme [Streptomyces sp. BE303]